MDDAGVGLGCNVNLIQNLLNIFTVQCCHLYTKFYLGPQLRVRFSCVKIIK